MKRLLLVGAALMVLAAVPLAANAQDEIVLEPVTIDVFGIQAVVPEGWQPVGPGVVARASSATDVALIAQQSAPIPVGQLLQAVLPQLGLTEAPEPVGELTTDYLTWTLYQVDVEAPVIGTVRVDVAMAQGIGASYTVMMQATTEEFDAFHEQIFLPALEALQPLVTTTEPEATDEPAPYSEEAVTFTGGAEDVTLAGTLTIPAGDGPFPAVVLVSGSGPQDRDETISGTTMRPFALLADALARAGVAVLRYDDRGAGESTGDFSTALTEDFTADAAAAIAWLQAQPGINPEQVGVLGHSEGGMVAAQLGAQDEAAFIISLAGPSVPGTELLLQQNRRLLAAMNTPQEDIDLQVSLLSHLFPLVLDGKMDEAEQYVREVAAEAYDDLDAATQAQYGSAERFANLSVQTLLAQFTPWMLNFLRLDPADFWGQTTAPVLALYGTLDVQVDADQNAGPLEAILTEAGNEDVTVVVLPGANHLFQAASTGAVQEYGMLPPEFTPDLIPTILDWLTEQGIIGG